MTKTAGFSALLPLALWLAACGDPPKPVTPALTPETASQLLHYNSRAAVWLAHAKKQDPTCEYKLELPNQMAGPVQVDVDHIMWCSGKQSSLELNASVSFQYDKAAGHWVIARFAS